MAKKYLDDNGLLYFWQKLKTLLGNKVDKESGKGLSTNDYTTNEKNKLSGIAAGAEVNQNAFSNVKVGSTTVAADAKTDTLELVAGDNVTITPDATNDKITIKATDTTYTPASASPKMDGTAAVGTSAKYAREDHVHPSDTSRVPATRTVNGHALSSNVTVSNVDLGQGYGTCTTATATTAKVVTLSNYLLTTGGIVAVKFSNAVNFIYTLNINSKGAKPVIFGDTTATSSVPCALTLAAGSIAYFIYNGSGYVYLGSYPLIVPFSAMPEAEAKAGVLTVSRAMTAAVLRAALDDHTTNTGAVATTTVQGYMSATDKTKLDKLVFDSNNLIDSSILPSYVDDVIEAYARSGATALSSDWLSLTSGGAALTPEAGKIYVLMADSGDYAANTQFRWSGSAYVKLADGGVSEITNAEIDTILAS